MIAGQAQIQFFEQALFETLGQELSIHRFEFVSGGCINNTVKLLTNAGQFFVKWNVQQLTGMFEAEARGLQCLQNTQTLPTPVVWGYGQKQDQAYLLLEFIETGYPAPDFWANFGTGLAALHRHSQASFGLDFDNYIGALPQQNTPHADGLTFFIEKRLQAQAGRAMYEGQLPKALYQKFTALYDKLADILPPEPPSLLHGDLWSGNFLVNPQGQALLIDPAVYYGFREAELAFTRLFGGFESAFYEAYNEAFPLEPGFEERIDIYNLYPLLVHVNLFGSGYLSGIERTLKKFVD
ncbi:MAG: fructosamine kinase family protein [Microscillaceae bacterium]